MLCTNEGYFISVYNKVNRQCVTRHVMVDILEVGHLEVSMSFESVLIYCQRQMMMAVLVVVKMTTGCTKRTGCLPISCESYELPLFTKPFIRLSHIIHQNWLKGGTAGGRHESCNHNHITSSSGAPMASDANI